MIFWLIICFIFSRWFSFIGDVTVVRYLFFHPGDSAISSIIIASSVVSSFILGLFGEVPSLSLLSINLLRVAWCCFMLWLRLWFEVVSLSASFVIPWNMFWFVVVSLSASFIILWNMLWSEVASFSASFIIPWNMLWFEVASFSASFVIPWGVVWCCFVLKVGGFSRPFGGLCPKFGVVMMRSIFGSSISPNTVSSCCEYCGSFSCLVHSSMLSCPNLTIYLRSVFFFFASLHLFSTDFIVLKNSGGGYMIALSSRLRIDDCFCMFSAISSLWTSIHNIGDVVDSFDDIIVAVVTFSSFSRKSCAAIFL